MSQATTWGVPSASPASPTAYATRDNAAFNALLTLHSGASRPAYAVAGTMWLDTTTATTPILKYYDGSNDITMAVFDHTNNIWTPVVNVGSDADGDTYYRASGALARLAKGAANTRMFMDAGAAAPEWAVGIKIGSITRVLTTGAGDVAYTGVGFKPSHIIFYSWANAGIAYGMDDGTTKILHMIYTNPTAYYNSASYSIYCYESAGAFQTAFIKTFDADGFTLTWAKSGSPTGSGYAKYIAFR